MLVKDGGRRGSARGANGVSGQMFSQLPSYGRKIWKNGIPPISQAVLRLSAAAFNEGCSVEFKYLGIVKINHPQAVQRATFRNVFKLLLVLTNLRLFISNIKYCTNLYF